MKNMHGQEEIHSWQKIFRHKAPHTKEPSPLDQ